MSIIEIARNILAEYDECSDSTHRELPISVDVLKDIIHKRSGLKTLQIKTVAIETPNIWGMIKVWYPVAEDVWVNESPSTAIVYVKEDLNFCWQRMITCKELCQCIIDIDKPENRVTSEEDLIIQMEGLATRHLNQSDIVNSEKQAELLAMEVLYPYDLRITHVDDLKAGRITSHDLALRYRIPYQYAELGMLDGYLNSVQGINRDEPKLAVA